MTEVVRPWSGLRDRPRMSHPRSIMRRRVSAVALMCALITVLSSQPASAAVGTAGSCQFGGKWKLTVDQFDATHLRVIFVIRSGAPGSAWQLFGSDNGNPFITRYKTADQYGVVRARWRPIDRAGQDAIEASGSGDGNTCFGSVSF
jgi:hypothetical protein